MLEAGAAISAASILSLNKKFLLTSLGIWRLIGNCYRATSSQQIKHRHDFLPGKLAVKTDEGNTRLNDETQPAILSPTIDPLPPYPG